MCIALTDLKFKFWAPLEIGRVIDINRRYKTQLIQGRAFIGGARA